MEKTQLPPVLSSLEVVARKVQESYKTMEDELDTSDDTVALGSSSQDSQEMSIEDQSLDISQDEGSHLGSSPAEFLLKPPITEEELRAISPAFHENIAKPLERFRKEGYAAYKAYLLKEKEEQEAKAKLKEAQRLESLQDAAILGNPRDYQTALFEVAKQRNTVIHLGTGKGKTAHCTSRDTTLCLGFRDGQTNSFPRSQCRSRHSADNYTTGQLAVYRRNCMPNDYQQRTVSPKTCGGQHYCCHPWCNA